MHTADSQADVYRVFEKHALTLVGRVHGTQVQQHRNQENYPDHDFATQNRDTQASRL